VAILLSVLENQGIGQQIGGVSDAQRAEVQARLAQQAANIEARRAFLAAEAEARRQRQLQTGGGGGGGGDMSGNLSLNQDWEPMAWLLLGLI